MGVTTLYTSKPLVKGYLPRSYSATTDLPDSSDTTYESIDRKILRVSRAIDSILGAAYCSFNSITGTPSTPEVIVNIATPWVAGLCLLQIAPGDRNSALASRGDSWVADSEARCFKIMTATESSGGSMVIPLETTTETLTFGSGTTFGLPVNEAYIQVHGNVTSGDMPTLIVDSVRPTLSGYTEYGIGRDFEVYFSGSQQKWIFRDINGAFRADSGTKSITYRWDWRRRTWAPNEATATSSGLIGGW